MRKNRIRLNESGLRRIVNESVRRVLNEISFETAQSAYQKSQDTNRQMSPAMQRRMGKNSMAYAQQQNALKNGATNSFNRDYGYNLKNVPYGSGDNENMTFADPRKPYYGGSNLYAPYGNYFSSIAGQGGNEQTNGRTTSYWGNNPNGYNERNIDVSLKNKIMNPQWANAVRRGEKALDNTIQRNG